MDKQSKTAGPSLGSSKCIRERTSLWMLIAMCRLGKIDGSMKQCPLEAGPKAAGHMQQSSNSLYVAVFRGKVAQRAAKAEAIHGSEFNINPESASPWNHIETRTQARSTFLERAAHTSAPCHMRPRQLPPKAHRPKQARTWRRDAKRHQERT